MIPSNEDIREKLIARAAKQGMTVSEAEVYIRQVLQTADTLRELFEQ